MNKYRVYYTYRTERGSNPIDSIQEFDFSNRMPLEESVFLPLLAENHNIEEELIKILKIEEVS